MLFSPLPSCPLQERDKGAEIHSRGRVSESSPREEATSVRELAVVANPFVLLGLQENTLN